MKYSASKYNVGYPVYGCKFLNDATLLVTGGGVSPNGQTNSTPVNKLTALRVDFSKKKVIKRYREILLDEKDDSPTTLDAATIRNGVPANNIILMGCNESHDDPSIPNHHLRKFYYENDHLRFVASADFNRSRDSKEYTKLTCLSDDGTVGAIASSKIPTVIRIIDPIKFVEKYEIETGRDVKDLAFSRDGKVICYVTETTLEVISIVTGRFIIRKTDFNSDWILSKVHFINDDTILVAGSMRSSKGGIVVTKVNIKSKNVTIVKSNCISSKYKSITAMDVDGKAQLAIIATDDNSVHIFKIGDLSLQKSFKQIHDLNITKVTFSPNSQLVATVSADKTVEVIKLPEGIASSTSFFYKMYVFFFNVFITLFVIGLAYIAYYYNLHSKSYHYISEKYLTKRDSSNYFQMNDGNIKITTDILENDIVSISIFTQLNNENSYIDTSSYIELVNRAQDTSSTAFTSIYKTDISTSSNIPTLQPSLETTTEIIEHNNQIHSPKIMQPISEQIEEEVIEKNPILSTIDSHIGSAAQNSIEPSTSIVGPESILKTVTSSLEKYIGTSVFSSPSAESEEIISISENTTLSNPYTSVSISDEVQTPTVLNDGFDPNLILENITQVVVTSESAPVSVTAMLSLIDSTSVNITVSTSNEDVTVESVNSVSNILTDSLPTPLYTRMSEVSTSESTQSSNIDTKIVTSIIPTIDSTSVISNVFIESAPTTSNEITSMPILSNANSNIVNSVTQIKKMITIDSVIYEVVSVSSIGSISRENQPNQTIVQENTKTSSIDDAPTSFSILSVISTMGRDINENVSKTTNLSDSIESKTLEESKKYAKTPQDNKVLRSESISQSYVNTANISKLLSDIKKTDQIDFPVSTSSIVPISTFSIDSVSSSSIEYVATSSFEPVSTSSMNYNGQAIGNQTITTNSTGVELEGENEVSLSLYSKIEYQFTSTFNSSTVTEALTLETASTILIDNDIIPLEIENDIDNSTSAKNDTAISSKTQLLTIISDRITTSGETASLNEVSSIHQTKLVPLISDWERSVVFNSTVENDIPTSPMFENESTTIADITRKITSSSLSESATELITELSALPKTEYPGDTQIKVSTDPITSIKSDNVLASVTTDEFTDVISSSSVEFQVGFSTAEIEDSDIKHDEL